MTEPRLNPRGDDPARPLPQPLGPLLRDPVDERRIPGMWRGIEARRGRLAVPLRTALVWASVGAVIGVLVMGSVAWLTGDLGTGSRAMQAPRMPSAAPLTLRDGTPLAPMEAPVEGSRTFRFSDGSGAVLEARARLEPLASSGREVILRLARGSAGFDVQPGGTRRWLVEAGLASVEVVGTRFLVHRSDDSVRVEVEHGVVLVRARTLPDGVQRLEAGQRVEIRVPTPPPGKLAAAPDPPSPALHAGDTPRAPAGPGHERWRGHAARGAYSDAYALLGADGVALEASRLQAPEDLMALADVARLSGHPHLAVAPLERLLRQYPTSAPAPLAAVTLGRIELGAGNAGRAAEIFESALALGPPAALVEDVHARLVEAHVKAGDAVRARAAWERYLRAFPQGRRRADIERCVPR